MKATSFWSASSRVAGIALAVLVALTGVVQAASVSELLGLLPEDAHIAVALPSIAGVEKEAAPLLALPFASDVEMVAAMMGGETLSEGLANYGINVDQPGAVFVSFDSPRDVKVGGVLNVKDQDILKEMLAGVIPSSADEVDLPGGLTAKYADSSNVGYFLQGDKVFIGSSISMLHRMAERAQTPKAVRYVPGAREEVVAFTSIDKLDKSGVLDAIPELGKIKPLIDTIRPFSDELLLAIGDQAGKAYLRAAAHDSGNSPVLSPGALALHGFMNPGAPLVANLRITPELVDVLSKIMVLEPSTRQVGGFVRMAAGLLDEELALSFNGLSGNIPDALIAAKVLKPDVVPGVLKMIAKIETPTYQLGENDVYVYEKLGGDTDLHIAVAGNTLVVAPGDEMLKNSMESFNDASGASGVDSTIVNQGVYGFVSLDGEKAAKALPDNILPANLDISKISLALTLGVDGEWREAVLSSPKGFDGFASLLNDLL